MRITGFLSWSVPVACVLLLAVVRHQEGVKAPIDKFVVDYSGYITADVLACGLIIWDAKRSAKEGNGNG